ncbi:MAG: PAS domain-containing protein, partial [Candidatus Thiodiazotropha taylori]
MNKQITSDELQAQLNLKLLERLRASERRYRELVSNLNQIVFQLDRDGRFVFLNQAWEDITGLPVVSALDQQLSHFLLETDLHEFNELLEQILSNNGQVFSFDTVLIGAGDREIPVEMSLNPQVEINDITGIIGTIIDVTEHKEMLHELNLNRERLFLAL